MKSSNVFVDELPLNGLPPRADGENAFFVFLESGSVETAERLIQSITERFDLLAAHPRAGRARDELRQGIRGFPAPVAQLNRARAF
jgi:plasmid stabilization system protein ParE